MAKDIKDFRRWAQDQGWYLVVAAMGSEHWMTPAGRLVRVELMTCKSYRLHTTAESI